MSRIRWGWTLPPVLAAAVALAIYLPRVMPTVGLWDTAEFQTIGAVAGVAHPTGYPSYSILLWLASVVLSGAGEPAYRANLLSALLVAGAVALTAIAVMQLTRKPPLALAAGVALAVTPVAWHNALRADPHPFHLFLATLLLVLLVGWAQRDRAGAAGAGRWFLGAVVVGAIAVGNHALTLLLIPGTIAYVIAVRPTILWTRPKLLIGSVIVGVLLVVAIYAYLPIRSMMGAPLDYAHPADWLRVDPYGNVIGGFRYLVLGEQFRGTFSAMPELGSAIGTIWTATVTNLGALAWVAAAGIPVGIVRRPREMVLTGLWFALTWAFALPYMNADITRYYLVPLLVAIVWAAFAVDGAWDAIATVLRGTWREMDRVDAERRAAVVAGDTVVAPDPATVAPQGPYPPMPGYGPGPYAPAAPLYGGGGFDPPPTAGPYGPTAPQGPSWASGPGAPPLPPWQMPPGGPWPSQPPPGSPWPAQPPVAPVPPPAPAPSRRTAGPTLESAFLSIGLSLALVAAVAWPALAPAAVDAQTVPTLVGLVERFPGADRLNDPDLDASKDTAGRIWLDSVLDALPPDAVVVSWWSFSTTLWYGLHAEGRRPDVLVIDDRDILDDGYGSGEAAIERYLGIRPVFAIRSSAEDVAALGERYRLEPLEGVVGWMNVDRVLPPEEAG